jgi:hypothetical protein
MRYRMRFTELLCILGQFALASTSQSEDLASRSKASTAREPEYEAPAITAFWGDTAFMRRCAPPAAPLAETFIIYVAISPSGKPTYQTAEPMTAVAQCVLSHTSARTYPRPKQEYVLSIQLRFER